jgi:hypothetical protein
MNRGYARGEGAPFAATLDRVNEMSLLINEIRGSPPQIETMGASQSIADARQSSRDIMSLRLVEYSRIRPQPVQVRLHVCSGSSCSTNANFGVLRIL